MRPVTQEVYRGENLDEYNTVMGAIYKRFGHTPLPSHFDSKRIYWNVSLLQNGLSVVSTEAPFKVGEKSRISYAIFVHGFSERKIGKVEKIIQKTLAAQTSHS